MEGRSRPNAARAADGKPAIDRAQSGVARPVRFAIVFALCLVTGTGLLILPQVQSVDRQFSRLLVTFSHGLIHICGGKADAQSAILRAPSGFAIVMEDGCNGANVTILLWAAMLAFPASWTMKVLGMLSGSLAIQILNMARFISLFYIGQYSRDWFDFAHEYLWETLLILDAMVVFWLWVTRVSRISAVPDARD
jgi:exosortase H (IPTLxxWG-CTERM-specific)